MSTPPTLPPKWATLFATWFGCGYAPKAPGTVGSLGAVPLFLLLSGGYPLVNCEGCPLQGAGACPLSYCAWGYWAAVLLLAALGTFSAQVVARHAGNSDPQYIVIDEVVGVLIALGIAQCSGLWALAVAWLLFRALDILKPWPLSAAERAKPPGLGIMLDDILAGTVAGFATKYIFVALGG